MASKYGRLESVAVFAALRVEVCSFADKILCKCYEPNEASIVEPGTSWRTWGIDDVVLIDVSQHVCIVVGGSDRELRGRGNTTSGYENEGACSVEPGCEAVTTPNTRRCNPEPGSKEKC
jgi:hypothetical protein